jgi:hypothetical protein
MLIARLARMFSPPLSLHTWPNRENILRWSWAGRGRQPASRNNTGAGVAELSYKVEYAKFEFLILTKC